MRVNTFYVTKKKVRGGKSGTTLRCTVARLPRWLNPLKMGDEEEQAELPPPEPLLPESFCGRYETPLLAKGESGNSFILELNPEEGSFTLTHRASFVALGTPSFSGKLWFIHYA